MPTEPTYPHRDEIEIPLLRALLDLNGSIRFSVRGRQVEDILAERFQLSQEQRAFSAPNYHSEGNRKWRNHIQFVRAQLVSKGEIDNSRYDVWAVTTAGYKRLGISPPANAPEPPHVQNQKKSPPKTSLDRALELLRKFQPK